jgi:1-acyl-sn-glycerol-3-phosphate acyltransferase
MRRHLHYVARKSLFKFAPFRWLITSLDAIPLDRDGMGLEGMKQTMKRLKASGAVLIFPEGTRTLDGEFQTFKPGFLTLARRTNAILLPVGIAGPYECWPRTQNYPSRGTVNIEFGPAIPLETMQAMSDDELMYEVERRVRECFEVARAKRQQRI